MVAGDTEPSVLLRTRGFASWPYALPCPASSSSMPARGPPSSMQRGEVELGMVAAEAGDSHKEAAVRLDNLSVCVLEKGAEVLMSLSGNVLSPSLDELIPEWRQEDAPIRVPVSSDKFWMLTKNKAWTLPSPFDNKGNYVISLSQLVRWMSVKAEELGVEVYPGFAASEILYDENQIVTGVATNDVGIAKDADGGYLLAAEASLCHISF
ncbi:hypothetical protein ZWY2020_039281 [Hordeum vulgare]|nr:hypothetical protein ZWY2020_039281 [Hordeum vulgare]